MDARRIAVSLLLAATSASTALAQSPYRLRDTYPGPHDSILTAPSRAGAVAVFVAEDPDHGVELWRTDGTPEGTVLLKDVVPGPASGRFHELAEAGGLSYLRIDVGDLHWQLWKTDGTEAGTVLVRDFPTGNANIDFLAAAGALLFFKANAPGAGEELWKTDGTTAGTVLVKDIFAGPNSSVIFGAAPFGSGIVFSARTQAQGTELWKSDGTTAGTVLVADINPGTGSSAPVGDKIALGSLLLFTATRPADGTELWATDGTAAGTRRVADIAAGPASSNAAGFVLRGGTAYFSASDAANGRELWRSDGTTAGTALVADIAPGPDGSGPGTLKINAGPFTYFSASHTGISPWDVEPFRTDGTAEGTVRVKDVNPGESSSIASPMGALGDVLYFAALEPVGGFELWRTDGTEEGTAAAGDINPGAADANPGAPLVLGSRLLFAAIDGTSGAELWAVDAEGPQVDAGPDQRVEVGEEATLVGGAVDPQGDPLTFEWRDASGTLLATTPSFSITLPAGRHVLTLTATDGAHRGSDSVVVRVGQSLQLTVFSENDGRGRVDADLGGSCAILDDGNPGVCELLFATGSLVTLTAIPEANATFLGWTGACSGTGSCQVTMDGTQEVQAQFAAPQHLFLALVANEDGAGAVRVDPPGTLCDVASGFCDLSFAHGTEVQLTPLPAPHSVFQGWDPEGPCAGTQTCTLTLDQSPFVLATFLGPRHLGVAVVSQEQGQGAIRIDPPGTVCELATGFCDELYTQGDVVTLTALPAPGSVFTGWVDPECPGTGPCVVTMDAHRTIGGTFLGPRHLGVAVVSQEQGQGAIRIDPPGTVCELATGFCDELYTQGDVVTLTALPAPGSVFTGWVDPECPGTGPCVVTMDAHRTIGGTFLGPRHLGVAVVSQEQGQGAIRIDPPGTVCELATGFCDELYTQGDVVTLTALPAPGSVFTGWVDPECPGTGPCVVTMDAHRTIGGTFLGPRHLGVAVVSQEQGQGAIRIDPPGTVCELTTGFCEELYTQGDVVTLTALPAPGSVFTGWVDPACPGTGPCVVTMDAHRTIGGIFLGQRLLGVSLLGVDGGLGAVRSDPPGALCELGPSGTAFCERTYEPDAVVVLTPLPAPGSVFEGWGAPCAGTGACTITLTQNTVVGGSFRHVNQAPSVVLTAPASGTVYPLAPASVAVTADAADSDGTIARVEFFANGVKVGESLAPPYGFLWAVVPPGTYTLTARATDDDGAPADSAPVTVIVNAPPTLSVTSPLPGASFVAPATVTLGADASDTDGAIVRVEFFEGAVSRGVDTTSPYSVVWSNVAAGAHALTAVATDDRGATVSVPFTVVVAARVTPAADAFVRDGDPFQNFGGENTLQVRKAGGSNNNRWTYLRFSVSALSTVSGARLRLFGHLTDEVPVPVNAVVFPVANTTWNERTITWHNKPATGATALAAAALDITTTDQRWYEWDVTAYVQAEKAAGRNVITLAIKNDTNTSARAVFRAREAGSSRPELVLTP